MSRPDVLYVVHRVPYPPDKGDRIRTFHVLEWLSRRADVHLACLADEPTSQDDLSTLGGYCRRLAVVPIGRERWARALVSLARAGTVTEGAFQSPLLRSQVREWARGTRFQAALVSASSMVPYLRAPELRDVPAVIDLTDVDSQKWLDYAEAAQGLRRWLYRFEGRRLRLLEQELATWARAVTVVSESEAELFRKFCPRAPVYSIENGVDLEYFRPEPWGDERGCVFVGALDYRPNIDAATWFCRNVWPELRTVDAGACLSLVGRRPTQAVRQLAGVPGVDVIGQVPDVRPHVARAAVVIAPLRIARGVQNKVLEALAMGKAVVASPQSLTGLGIEPGIHLLAADSPSEWREAVGRLLRDADLRRQLGQQGRRFVEAHHCWDRCLEPFTPLVGLPECGTYARDGLDHVLTVPRSSEPRFTGGGSA